MKYLPLLIVASFVAYVAADEDWKPMRDRATLMEVHEDCRKGTRLTDEQNEKIVSGQYPDEKEVHDFVLCKTKRVGVFTDDKGYDIDRMTAQLGTMYQDTEKLRAMVTSCIDSNEQKSSIAEWAFRGKQCMMMKMDEMMKEGNKMHTS